MSDFIYECEKKGCYYLHRSDPCMFDGCFPMDVSMGDVDGLVELGGQFLLTEYKRPGIILKDGQRRMHQALVQTGHFTTLVVSAERQTVSQWQAFSSEVPTGQLYVGDTETLRQMVWDWTRSVAPTRAPGRLSRQRMPRRAS